MQVHYLAQKGKSLVWTTPKANRSPTRVPVVSFSYGQL